MDFFLLIHFYLFFSGQAEFISLLFFDFIFAGQAGAGRGDPRPPHRPGDGVGVAPHPEAAGGGVGEWGAAPVG